MSLPAFPRARAAVVPALAASLACLPGCAAPRTPPASVGGAAGGVSVVIGVALPARVGMAAIERGATLAVETLAADPRALRQGVRFAVARTPASAPGAVAAAERLRDDPAVVGIVGDAESGRTLDALPVVEDAAGGGARALVAVSPTATSPALAGRSPWLFRLSPSDDAASRSVAAYALDSLGARRAAVVYRADSYGRDWTATFVRAFAGRGGTVVARDPYLAGVTDWPAYAQALARVRPDVVLFPGSADAAAELLRALRAAGVRAPLVGGDAVAPLADSAEFAGAGYRVLYAATFTAGWANSPGAPASARQFAARYQARYGERPGVRAAMGYEAALLIGQAALAVDLTAPDRRRRIRDQLAALGRTAPAALGVMGPVAFDAQHGVVGRGVLVTAVGAPGAAVPGAGAPAAVAAR